MWPVWSLSLARNIVFWVGLLLNNYPLYSIVGVMQGNAGYLVYSALNCIFAVVDNLCVLGMSIDWSDYPFLVFLVKSIFCLFGLMWLTIGLIHLLFDIDSDFWDRLDKAFRVVFTLILIGFGVGAIYVVLVWPFG